MAAEPLHALGAVPAKLVGEANVLVVPTDVSKLEEVVRLRDRVYEAWGEVRRLAAPTDLDAGAGAAALVRADIPHPARCAAPYLACLSYICDAAAHALRSPYLWHTVTHALTLI